MSNPSSPPPANCPSCSAPLAHHAVLCVACGYHLQQGKHLTTERPFASQPAPTSPSPRPTSDNPFASPYEESRDDGVGMDLGPLFTTEGRIGRGEWWIIQLGALVSFVVLVILLVRIGYSEWIIAPLLWATIGISLFAEIRRWHDVGKSGWWCLVKLIPVVGMIYTLIVLGFEAGEEGENYYGPAPLR